MGKLIFISKCVRQIFIAHILILLRKVHFNHHHVNLTAEFRKDIAWQRRFLRAYNGVSMISIAQWSSPGAVFTTDACLTGCSGLCGGQYFHGVFPSYVVQQTLDINCLELLTIIVALKLWGSRLYGLRLSVRCDNEVAVTVLTTGRCRNFFLNSCLRELCCLAAIHEFEVLAVHVPGVSNCYADLLSRWDSCDIAGRNQPTRNTPIYMRFLSTMTCFNLTMISDPVFFRFRLSRTSEASSGPQTISAIRIQLWDVQ